MKSFDLLSSPLSGVRLIDASAGTGKTYTITGLVLRLLLEEGLSIDDILIVTYTEAATEDLRCRIRETIRQGYHYCSGDRRHELFDALLQGQDLRTARQKLLLALRSFDEAAIYTIHGFCQKVLLEFGLESGALFEAELVPDLKYLAEEVVLDFYRKHFYNASPLFIEYCGDRFLKENLLRLLDGYAQRPGVEIIPNITGVAADGSSDLEQTFSATFSEACGAWAQGRQEVENILTTDEALQRNRYRPASVSGWMQTMDELLAEDRPVLNFFEAFKKFTSSEIEASIKKGQEPPRHSFFDLCDKLFRERNDLAALYDRSVVHLKGELFGYYRRQYPERKKKNNVYSFDDLLHQVYSGLLGPNGRKFAHCVRSRFKAALIDEFQDTDPVQYKIFSTIYNGDGHLLYLIGDPKQAIYSFRGADVFTYMDAIHHVHSRSTLEKNWRSDPQLVKAVNAIFSRALLPFVYKDIPFSTVGPALRNTDTSFSVKGCSVTPFQLLFLERSGLATRKESGQITKEIAYDAVAKIVAAEIVRLLDLGREGQALIGGRPVMAKDMAVLVRKNREARLMQKVLASHGIVSVVHGTESVFSSREAEELQCLLSAVAEPGNEHRLKAALVTEILGLDGGDLGCLLEDEALWQEWLFAFRRYHELWLSHGFMRMFRQILDEQHVRARLLAFSDGERRLTNILHLAEVLHRAITERHLGIIASVSYLSEKMRGGDDASEEHLLRLESDRECLRIVTVHKAKGLEYPIVFCPFTWGSMPVTTTKHGAASNSRDLPPLVFHPSEERAELVIDLGSPEYEENRQIALREELAESLRLFYVALTRASHCCYLLWGGFSGCQRSAPAYLFHQAGGRSPDEIIRMTGERVKGMTDAEMLADLAQLADEAGDSIELRKVSGTTFLLAEKRSLADHAPHLSCRVFSHKIRDSRRITSFSSMVQSRRPPDIPDYDAVPSPSEIEASTGGEAGKGAFQDIFVFPAGARAGTFMHDLLEHLDFSKFPESGLEKIIKDKLMEHGFDPSWHTVIHKMLDNIVHTPLLPEKHDFTFSAVSADRKISELEFYFPLDRLTPSDLHAFFQGQAGKSGEPVVDYRFSALSFGAVEGFMKGFIDLVFEDHGRYYLVDWKSNMLGDRIENYGRRQLSEVMQRSFYNLQYHIYTVALHHYLALRKDDYDYGLHFGGVFYIFLRGVDKKWGSYYGIFFDRPDKVLIEKLSARFTPGRQDE